jgi:hypothetical protein
MNVLHWIVLLAFAISHAGGDRWDCPPCGGGPANSPGGQALDTCAGDCLQVAPVGSECDEDTSSDCICNGAHSSLAIQAIASCVMASCNIPADVAAATIVASTWCAQWSQTAAPDLVTPYTNVLATTLPTPSATTNGQGEPVPTQGKWLLDGCGIIAMTIFVTAGSGGGNGGLSVEGSGGLSRGDKIALGVGIGFGVPTAVAAIIAIYQACQ